MVSVLIMIMIYFGKCINDNKRFIMVSIFIMIKIFDSKCINDDKGL